MRGRRGGVRAPRGGGGDGGDGRHVYGRILRAGPALSGGRGGGLLVAVVVFACGAPPEARHGVRMRMCVPVRMLMSVRLGWPDSRLRRPRVLGVGRRDAAYPPLLGAGLPHAPRGQRMQEHESAVGADAPCGWVGLRGGRMRRLRVESVSGGTNASGGVGSWLAWRACGGRSLVEQRVRISRGLPSRTEAPGPPVVLPAAGGGPPWELQGCERPMLMPACRVR